MLLTPVNRGGAHFQAEPQKSLVQGEGNAVVFELLAFGAGPGKWAERSQPDLGGRGGVFQLVAAPGVNDHRLRRFGRRLLGAGRQSFEV